jgi:hypothetical protein
MGESFLYNKKVNTETIIPFKTLKGNTLNTTRVFRSTILGLTAVPIPIMASNGMPNILAYRGTRIK